MAVQPPEAGEGPGADFPNSLGRDQPCQPLDFAFPVSRPWENKSLLFKHSVCGALLRPRQDTDQAPQALAHLPDGDTEAQLVGGDGWGNGQGWDLHRGCLTPQLGTPPTAPVASSNRERSQTAGALERLCSQLTSPWGPLLTPQPPVPLGRCWAPSLGWALTESSGAPAQPSINQPPHRHAAQCLKK